MTALHEAIDSHHLPVVAEDEPVVEPEQHASTPPARRKWRAFRRNRAAMVSLVFLVIMIVIVPVFAGVIAPQSPTDTDLTAKFETPSTEHWLGTDDLGRDMFSRLVYATRVSLLVSVSSVLIAVVIALPIGALSGYATRGVDSVLMRAMDVLLSIPALMLVFAVAGVLGRSLVNTAIALSIIFAPVFVRLIRDEVRTLKRSQLVEAERSLGASPSYIFVRHMLPKMASPMIVQITLGLATAILAEASLSFLGLGVQPPASSWGSMLATNYTFVFATAWPVFVPGLAIVFTVLALNVLGDGIRDVVSKVRS
ncbi:MAG: ABC transporter permease [Actinomycetota bacterium]|nr:ABC transporter permease [Actinomycetota bacterium]